MPRNLDGDPNEDYKATGINWRIDGAIIGLSWAVPYFCDKSFQGFKFGLIFGGIPAVSTAACFSSVVYAAATVKTSMAASSFKLATLSAFKGLNMSVLGKMAAGLALAHIAVTPVGAAVVALALVAVIGIALGAYFSNKKHKKLNRVVPGGGSGQNSIRNKVGRKTSLPGSGSTGRSSVTARSGLRSATPAAGVLATKGSGTNYIPYDQFCQQQKQSDTGGLGRMSSGEARMADEQLEQMRQRRTHSPGSVMPSN